MSEKEEQFLSKELVDELRNEFERFKIKNRSNYDFPLVVPPFDFDEILESIHSLLSTRVTMGEKVFAFEKDFAKYLGVKHAIMVNSGSSANLIAMSVLINPSLDAPLEPGDKVVVPALTWSTSIFPIVDVGAIPVFADSDKETLNLDSSSVRNCIDDKVKAIMAVHLIGNPCAMNELCEIADEHGLYLIEDCCEAHGAEYGGKKVGTLSELGTYSFFFSHHISTIEGGMVVTDNDEYAELARILRAHGWTRDMMNRSKIEKKYEKRDPRFLFVNRGYNLRPTEIQGAFGLHQIKKLDGFVAARRKSASILLDSLESSTEDIDFQVEQEGGKHSWFGFPFIIRDGGWTHRKKIIEKLERNGIETRVVMGGNMATQPSNVMYKYESPVSLDVAQHVDRSGILIGLHHALSDDDCVDLADRIAASTRDV